MESFELHLFYRRRHIWLFTSQLFVGVIKSILYPGVVVDFLDEFWHKFDYFILYPNVVDFCKIDDQLSIMLILSPFLAKNRRRIDDENECRFDQIKIDDDARIENALIVIAFSCNGKDYSTTSSSRVHLQMYYLASVQPKFERSTVLVVAS